MEKHSNLGRMESKGIPRRRLHGLASQYRYVCRLSRGEVHRRNSSTLGEYIVLYQGNAYVVIEGEHENLFTVPSFIRTVQGVGVRVAVDPHVLRNPRRPPQFGLA